MPFHREGFGIFLTILQVLSRSNDFYLGFKSIATKKDSIQAYMTFMKKSFKNAQLAQNFEAGTHIYVHPAYNRYKLKSFFY